MNIMDEQEKVKRLIQQERIGELLVGAKKINLNQLMEAMEEQERRRTTIGHILVEKGFVKEDDLETILEQQERIKEVVESSIKELGLNHLLDKKKG